jgi:hypothetical protein
MRYYLMQIYSYKVCIDRPHLQRFCHIHYDITDRQPRSDRRRRPGAYQGTSFQEISFDFLSMSCLTVMLDCAPGPRCILFIVSAASIA